MSFVILLEIAKIGRSENLTHLPRGIFANISRREKIPIYGTVEFTRLRQDSNLKCICKLFKADMNTDIPLETATIFFKRTFI